MGDEDESHLAGGHTAFGQPAVGGDDRFHVGLEHPGRVEGRSGLVHGEVDARPLGTGRLGPRCHGPGEVLPVLAAAGVGGVGGGGERHDPPRRQCPDLTGAPAPTARRDLLAGSGCLEQGRQPLGHEGVPVAVPPAHGDSRAAAGELGAQGHEELAVAGVDRGDSTEALVVAGDLHEAGVGHATSGGGIAHEGQDVVGSVGAAVGQQEHGVVGCQRVGTAPGARRRHGPDGSGRRDGVRVGSGKGVSHGCPPAWWHQVAGRGRPRGRVRARGRRPLGRRPPAPPSRRGVP